MDSAGVDYSRNLQFVNGQGTVRFQDKDILSNN
jgi:hypothetical protein